MFESVTASVRYAKAPTAIGVVTHGDKALLIDSGAGRVAFGDRPLRGLASASSAASAACGAGRVAFGDRPLRGLASASSAASAACGLDENLARKVINSLANERVSVAAVINTHAHADHIGQRRTCGFAAPMRSAVRSVR